VVTIRAEGTIHYGDILTRSFRISWRHRYLWFLAVLAGEGGGGGSGGSGNFPQAFSHIGLINSALQLERAEARLAAT